MSKGSVSFDFAVITSHGFTCCKGKHFLNTIVQKMQEIDQSTFWRQLKPLKSKEDE